MDLISAKTALRPALENEDTRISFPFFDVKETPSHYMLCLDVSTALGEEVEIELNDDELILTGRGPPNTGTQVPRVSLKVNSEKFAVAAHYHDGRLTIALPKEPSQRKNTISHA